MNKPTVIAQAAAALDMTVAELEAALEAIELLETEDGGHERPLTEEEEEVLAAWNAALQQR